MPLFCKIRHWYRRRRADGREHSTTAPRDTCTRLTRWHHDGWLQWFYVSLPVTIILVVHFFSAPNLRIHLRVYETASAMWGQCTASVLGTFYIPLATFFIAGRVNIVKHVWRQKPCPVAQGRYKENAWQQYTSVISSSNAFGWKRCSWHFVVPVWPWCCASLFLGSDDTTAIGMYKYSLEWMLGSHFPGKMS